MLVSVASAKWNAGRSIDSITRNDSIVTCYRAACMEYLRNDTDTVVKNYRVWIQVRFRGSSTSNGTDLETDATGWYL